MARACTFKEIRLGAKERILFVKFFLYIDRGDEVLIYIRDSCRRTRTTVRQGGDGKGRPGCKALKINIWEKPISKGG
jgi:hypothetical protein